MSTNDGGPAFPLPFVYDPDRGQCGEYVDASDAGVPTGMTLRDWFAGQVLAGQWTLRESEAAHIQQPTATDMAQSAYRIADAMLAARNTHT